MANRWLSRAIFASLTGVGLAGCNAITGAGDLVVDDGAFDAARESGVVTGEGGTINGPVDAGDAGSDAHLLGNVDAAVVDGCSSTGCVTMPSGFQLVAFGPAGAPCPTDFGTPSDVVTDATLSPNACSCGCALGTPPTCSDNGPIELTFGTAGTNCPNALGSVSGGCSTDGFLGPFSAVYERRYTPPPGTLVGGTCSATPAKDPTKLKSGTARLCQANVLPQCGAQICPPTLGGGFKACIATAGAVPCPAAFPNAKQVGASADFVCKGSCSCTVKGNCGGGVVRFFDTDDCSGPIGLTISATGACLAIPANAGPFASRRYVPDAPTSAGCNAAGSATPDPVELTQLATVCCN